jgi:arsenate reductase-like glutaredoxin family protein
MSADAAFEKLLRDQRLIRLPLVRAGNRLSVGLSEDEWRAWLRAADQ